MNKIFTVLALFFSVLIYGQTTISGTVTDSETSEPLPGVNIKVVGKSLGTSTDFDGNFVFEVPKEYTNSNLVISCVGYKERKMKLNKMIGKLDIIIELESTSVEIDEVVGIVYLVSHPCDYLAQRSHFLSAKHLLLCKLSLCNVREGAVIAASIRMGSRGDTTPGHLAVSSLESGFHLLHIGTAVQRIVEFP